MRPFLGIVLFVSLAPFARSQSVADALRSPVKSLTVADLPATYRAVSIGEGGMNSLSLYALAGIGGGSTEDERSGVLFSLIGATFVDPDEFSELLEGKRPRVRGYSLDFANMIRESTGKGAGRETPTPVFAETWIEGGRILQWSPRPAISREALLKVFGEPGKPNVAAAKSAALSNAKQAALGIMMYLSDSDEKFPNADSTAKAQSVVEPYTKSAEIWKNPNPNGGRLLYNTSLSRTTQAAIESPSETLLLWDEKAWPDGTRVVAFTDGHVKSVSASEWTALWAAELRRRGSRP